MIKFDIEYYDNTERDLFSKAGYHAQFQPLLKAGIDIDEFDLIAKAMFMEQKNKPGWLTRDDLISKAMTRVDQFDQYFECASGSLRARHDATEMGVNTEWMGVGASLAAMDAAFGTHDADWEKIPVANRKDLDFKVASNGTRFVVVESKGSIVDDVAYKTSSISQHKSDIKAKKSAQRTNRKDDILIGTIAAIPTAAGQRAKIWLVDPPLPRAFTDPARFQVLSRLRYYRELIRVLGKPHFLNALSTRIAALEQLSDIAALDGAPLVNGDEEPFGVPTSFRQNRSHSVDGRLVVTTWPSRHGIRVMGMDTDVISVMVSQKQLALRSWRSDVAGRRSQDFVLLLDPEVGVQVSGARPTGAIRRDGTRPYLVTLDINVSTSGLVFGGTNSESDEV